MLRLLLFCIGACVGSFLGVCVYRIPRHKSVIFPKSKCDFCGKHIAWYHNIPILSWIFLRGRAACCGKKIAFKYFFIELLTAIVFAMTPLDCYIGPVFASLLIPTLFIDAEHQIIPDRFSVGGAILGLMLAAFYPLMHGTTVPFFGFVRALTGMMIGSAVLLWIGIIAECFLKREAMGFGDIKLLGCIGAFNGWVGAIESIFIGAILATCVLTLIAVFQKLHPRMSKLAPLVAFGKEVPFGPFLAVAAYLPWLLNGKYEIIRNLLSCNMLQNF